MPRLLVLPLLTTLLLFLLAQPLPAEEKKEDQQPVEDMVTSAHETTIGGKEIKYTVTVGKLPMKSDEGKPKAHIFFVAYTKHGVEDLGKRPLTFAFNGGPGSSSVWLHLGMLGPQRIRLPDDASHLRPPYELSANPHSILDLTDLVFIDPVSTGFSRPAEGEDKGQFHGYQQDLNSVGEFIHHYLSEYGRWRSPKFLIGESYGGFRAAGLSGHLFNRYNIPISGIVMVSPATNFNTLSFASGTDIGFALFLPSYTATAWYHKALPADLKQLPVDELYRQSHEFAMGEYLLALAQGHDLDDDKRAAVAEKLSRLTGLSKTYVEQSNLRIPMQRFGKELLRDRGLTIGRFDSRYTAMETDAVGDTPDFDPSAAAIFGPDTAAINDYLREELKFDDHRVYEILTGNVHPWKYDNFGSRTPDTTDTLRETMTANPHMKVLFACGYYDLATPPGSVEYSASHLRLPKPLRENVKFTYYEGGHMMYVYEPAMEQLRKDVEAFYAEALGDAEEK